MEGERAAMRARRVERGVPGAADFAAVAMVILIGDLMVAAAGDFFGEAAAGEAEALIGVFFWGDLTGVFTGDFTVAVAGALVAGDFTGDFRGDLIGDETLRSNLLTASATEFLLIGEPFS